MWGSLLSPLRCQRGFWDVSTVFLCIPLGCGYSGCLPAGGSRGAKGLRVFLHLRGETEALGLMGAGLGGHLVPFSIPSGFLWLCCFW